ELFANPKKMHDFCFTIPYGMLLIGGGFIGYMKKGSITSFAGGAVAGLLLILAGYLSLKAFEKKKNSSIAVVLQTVISAALTLVMGQRYLLTQKVMPAGLVAGISALMTCFYVYKIATARKVSRREKSPVTMAFPRMTASSSSWQTLHGKPPVVVARGGFSGLLPDSSENAYKMVKLTTSPDVTLWCDLQLTKDGAGICFPNLNLDNASNVKDVYPNHKEWLSVGFTWKELSTVTCKWFFNYLVSLNPLLDSDCMLKIFLSTVEQGVFSRLQIFDDVSNILRIEEVAKLGTSGLWLNIQHSDFYTQHNLSMRNFVLSISSHMKINFISSPDISFLKSVKKDVKPTKTKLIFRFLSQDQIDPFTNQSYASLAKNLTFIKTFSSGILVPKSYIWPVSSDLYLQPHTSLVTDAHRQGLQVFASEFANDAVSAYNYSYDPTNEYLYFIDNGNFSVDGFLSDFPLTPYRAINCFSHLDKKKATKQANITIISKDGASGDFSGGTDLAYEKAVRDGVDFIDCNVQMSKDKIPFCMSSIDLMNSTNVIYTSFRNLSSTVSEIQQGSGIFTFSLTMSEIQTLKPIISNPHRVYGLFRNPRNKNLGKFLTLSEFLLLPNRYSSLSGSLIKIEYAAYLATHQGISIVDAVLYELKRATSQVLIQSTDKAVLIEFKEKGKMTNEELVYAVDEDIHDVADSAIKDIKSFAGSIVISKKSVVPYSEGIARLEKETDVVPRLRSSGLRVYVETFSNEFITQPYDFFSDPTVEIDYFVRGDPEVDGIITDFPATTSRYTKNPCYSKMEQIRTGELVSLANREMLSPAEAPYPQLLDSNVTEPPLPEVRIQPPAPAPAKEDVKSKAKAVQVSSTVRAMVVLVSIFIIRRFTRRSSSRQSIKEFDNISFKTDSSRRRYIYEEITKLGRRNISAQIFTFQDLSVATRNFDPENQLGEGGFGRVYKGYIETNDKVVAVKQLDRNGYQGNREFLVEVMMLGLLHHQNLVNLVGYCADGDQRILKPLDWDTRMKVAAGAARGLEYLHETADPPVIYRDFKTSNILLDEEFNPKLSDFGLAKVGPTGGETHVSTRVMGTYGYCAPEYALTGQLTVKSDVYSFGVVFLEMITGRRVIDPTKPTQEENLVTWASPLFKDRRKFTLMADPLLEGKYPIIGLYQALAVAAMCLQEEAATRPMMSDVVSALEYLAMTKDKVDAEAVEDKGNYYN
ncbi:hypothetical protein HID58_093507, partial [Brassica napus]